MNQLLPEPSVNNDDRFGSALAANSNFIVVGAENSDTLGILYGGAVFLYEKTPAGWAYRAMLTPSNPISFGFFGNDVAIDPQGEVVVVIDRRYPKGFVYIYEKPVGGWTSMQESVRVELPDFLEHYSPVSISEDATKIVVGSPGTNTAKFYIIHQSGSDWSSPMIEVVPGPDLDSHANIFGVATLLKGDYLYVSSDNDPSGSGIYVYKRNVTGFDYLAKLSQSLPMGAAFYYGRILTATDDMVATMGLVYIQDGDSGDKLFIYKRNGEWEDAVETVRTSIPGYESSLRFPTPIQFVSSTELAISLLEPDGDYYKGKTLLVTATNSSWQSISSEMIHEQVGLSQRSDYALNMVWNGTELIRSVGAEAVGFAYRESVVSITRSEGIWGSLQNVTVSRKNSSRFFHGLSVRKTPEGLLAGAPYDGSSGRGAGAVYVYERYGEDHSRKHIIRPSQRRERPTGGSDSGFGYSLAISGDELAVGAPSYRYSNSSSGLGKIFLYKRITSSWSSALLYDSVSAPEELMLNHIGAAVAMNGDMLFASAYNNLSDLHTNAVIIYEKIDGKWMYQDVLYFGKPLDKSWPSVRLDIHQNMLVVGNYFTIGGGISFVSKNTSTGKWEINFSIDAEITSGFGGAVKLLDNHLFVGVPAYTYNGVQKSGAVYVYAKLPGKLWTPSMQPTAIIGAENPVEGGYFGSSIDAIGNTLVVGAPGKFLTEDNQVRTVPGNTYIIQSKDFFWHETYEYLNLQGNRYSADEQDNFGASVSVDEEMFFIGSRNENTPSGSFSGAVYYIPTPPVIFLNPPVCESSDPIQLYGYPFGGVWTGPGVTPTGLFDPGIVGQGTTILTYTTPNCAYEGKVHIEVGGSILIELLSPTESILCNEGEIVLEVVEIPDATYEWYFMKMGTNSFVSIGPGGPVRSVNVPGEYYVLVSGLLCSQQSAIFYVTVEGELQVSIGPQTVVCENHQSIPLIATYDIGTWEGPGVEDNHFHSGTLGNGVYPLLYSFITPLGCVVNLKDSIEVRIIEPIVITRLPGDFCSTGTAFLKVEVDNPELVFTWFYRESETVPFNTINKPLNSEVIVYEQGYYQVTASNGDCVAYSEPVQIGFNSDMAFQIFPEENTLNIVCNEAVYLLTVSSRDGTSYTWEYAPTEEDEFKVIGSGQGTQKVIEETGRYTVRGVYGFCSFQSAPFYIKFESTQVFAPNVFTPNGDQFNSDFHFETNTEVLLLRIFNRYGELIYNSPDGSWQGGDYPAGMYYWFANFRGCDEEVMEMKGWVQLIR
ncbi:MAG: gliding motility-associated C-terminal domain-containing protein [Cyclobacteriaceae bacterium]|nr:gliding motility-associated C-terminal domain-containing protein [Cyclobacteriaceae bacterium]